MNKYQMHHDEVPNEGKITQMLNTNFNEYMQVKTQSDLQRFYLQKQSSEKHRIDSEPVIDIYHRQR